MSASETGNLSRKSASGFRTRWLIHAGMPDDRAEAAALKARERAARFDRPISTFYPLASWLVDWIGPLLLLRTPHRARKLSDDAFSRYLEKVKTHRIPAIRLVALLVLVPLMEVLTAEQAPKQIPHPLDGESSDDSDDNAAETALQRVDDTNFDVVIIGSGAGGAPVAWALSRSGLRVAVVEKGGMVRPESGGGALEKHYVSQGMIGSVDGGSLVVLAGETVGGSTSINSGTCLRPHEDCLATWDALLGTDFVGGDLDGYFEQVEKQIGVTVLPRELLDSSGVMFDRGLKALGRDDAYVLPRNAPGCKGSGRCCFGCPTGAKQSTDRAFLPQAVEAGTRLFSHTTASNISEDIDDVRVTVDGPQGRRTLTCKHLVVAGGALFTPGILKRNRLGTHWQQAGTHLKIHPASKVFAHFPDLEHRGGIPQGLGYRPPELPRVTMEGAHTPKSVMGPMFAAGGDRFKWWLDHSHELVSFGMMIQDRTTGKVIEVAGRPWIRYRMHPDDVRDLGAGLLLAAEAFFAIGAERVLLPMMSPNNEPKTLEELKKIQPEDFHSLELLVSGFHPQGTAGLGRIVDNDLLLKGCKRISVCDASVLPDSPGVNPQIAIMAFALRLADHLSEELGGSAA